MTHKKPRILQRIFSIANEGFYKKIIIFGIKIKLQNFKYRRYLTKKYISPQGIIDNAPCGFKQYLLKNNMPEKIELLKSNLDEQSIKILNETLDKILNLPDYFYAQYYKICPSTFNKRFMTVVEKEYIRKIAKNEKKIKREYRLSDNVYDMEVFINHHGLSYASKKIREYIQDKDFIDAGAFIGDSALVFLKYNPRKIYSFEISKKSIVRYKKTMAMNNVPKDKYELIEKGLSDKVASKFIFDSGNMNVRVFTDNGEKIELVDLDSFVQSKNLNIGFIKADVEGALLDVLRGMKSVIRNNRPVMSLAIYHSPYEFFEAKPLLDSYIEDLNYKIELRSDFPSPEHIYGTVLWAYPKELC